MKPVIRFGVALALVGAIGACGSDSTGPTYDDTVTSAMAEDVAEGAYFTLMDMVGEIAGGGGPAAPAMTRARAMIQEGLASARPSAVQGYPGVDLTRLPQLSLAASGILVVAPGCSSSETGMDGGGDPIDANGNGVPDDYRQITTCEFVDSAGVDSLVTIRQEIEMVARERSGDLIGFDFLLRISLHVTSNFGIYILQDQRQEEGLSLRTDRITTHVLSSLVLRQKPVPDAVELRVEQYQRADMRYDPDGNIVFESPIPDGEIQLNGEFRFVNSDTPIAVRFVLDTPEPLQYSAACTVSDDQPFVGGVMRGRFNGRSSVGYTIEFNPCGDDFDFETFGTDDGAPASRPFAARSFRH